MMVNMIRLVYTGEETPEDRAPSGIFTTSTQ